jgi:Phage tail lysozyme
MMSKNIFLSGLQNFWGLLQKWFAAERPTPNSPNASIWTTKPRAARMIYVMDALITKYNFPVAGAAGLVGNLYAESALIPNRIEGSQVTSPMYARDFSGNFADFSPEEVMNRISGQQGPKLAGAGLAQWTYPSRRKKFFTQSLGANILFDMDAQLDFLVEELKADFARVYATLMDENTSVEVACDEVVLKFERPADQSEAHLQVRRGYAKDAYVYYVKYKDGVMDGKS